MAQNRPHVIPTIIPRTLQQVENKHLFAVQLNWDSTTNKWEATLKQKGFPDERFGLFDTASQAEECMRLILGKCQDNTAPKEVIHDLIGEVATVPTIQTKEELEPDNLYQKYGHMPNEVLKDEITSRSEEKRLQDKIRAYRTMRRVARQAIFRQLEGNWTEAPDVPKE
jgi:hypothetical protein